MSLLNENFEVKERTRLKKLREEAKKCKEKNTTHDYMPISWKMNAKAKHVNTLMCRECLFMINIGDLQKLTGQDSLSLQSDDKA